VRCIAPTQRHHVIRTVLRKFESESTVSMMLSALSDELLQYDILNQLKKGTMNSIKKSFVAGSPPADVSNAMERTARLAAELARLDGRQLDSYFTNSDIILPNGQVNLECQLPDYNYREDHPLCGMIEWESKFKNIASCAYVALAVEGYGNLLSWCKEPGRSTWDTEKEVNIICIAAYLGHGNIVDLFLQKRDSQENSSETRCFHAALLGAAEAGDVDSLALYMKASMSSNIELPPDAITTSFQMTQLNFRDFRYKSQEEEDKERKQRRDQVAASIIASAVFAYLHGLKGSLPEGDESRADEANRKVIHWLVSNSGVDARFLVRAAAVVMVDPRNLHCSCA